jgi:hypothetical protein
VAVAQLHEAVAVVQEVAEVAQVHEQEVAQVQEAAEEVQEAAERGGAGGHRGGACIYSQPPRRQSNKQSKPFDKGKAARRMTKAATATGSSHAAIPDIPFVYKQDIPVPPIDAAANRVMQAAGGASRIWQWCDRFYVGVRKRLCEQVASGTASAWTAGFDFAHPRPL